MWYAEVATNEALVLRNSRAIAGECLEGRLQATGRRKRSQPLRMRAEVVEG
jgi:hypothetical protein